MPAPDHAATYAAALSAIRKILDATHPDATPGEKLVRIGWVIGRLPEEFREAIVNEARNRVVIGWAAGLDPTEFQK